MKILYIYWDEVPYCQNCATDLLTNFYDHKKFHSRFFPSTLIIKEMEEGLLCENCDKVI